MGLFLKLRKHTSDIARSDHRDYTALLRNDADTPDALQRLAMLALKLGKTSEQIEQDRKAILRVPELRAKIAAAREAATDLTNAGSTVREHQAETARVNAQRSAEEKLKREELGRLLGIKNAGEDAIAELNKLKSQNADLLADEQAVELTDLQ